MNSEPLLVVCKCDFKGDLRRFRLLSTASFENLKLKLESLYSFEEDVIVKYVDDQGDEITMATEEDFQEAILLVGNDLLRLEVKDSTAVEEAKLTMKAVPEPTTGNPTATNSKSPNLDDFNWIMKQVKYAQKAKWNSQKVLLKQKPINDVNNNEKGSPSSHGQSVKLLARFVSHGSLFDGEVLKPGEQRYKSWRVRNDSDKSWPQEGVTLTYVSGGSADRLCTSEMHPVAGGLQPGCDREVGVTVVAPLAPGAYQGYWRLRGPTGAKFGQRLGCSVMVATEVGIASRAQGMEKLAQCVERKARQTEKAAAVAERVAQAIEKLGHNHPDIEAQAQKMERDAHIVETAARATEILAEVVEKVAEAAEQHAEEKEEEEKASKSERSPSSSSESEGEGEEDEGSDDGFVQVRMMAPLPVIWTSELAILRQVGLANEKQNVKLLKKYDGNVTKVAKKVLKKNAKKLCTAEKDAKKEAKQIQKAEKTKIKAKKVKKGDQTDQVANSPTTPVISETELQASAVAAVVEVQN
mmetsp:Transcript_8452/g.11415  ORF Transcript_8452/g.11415 Transcript_8452/m.11415 type:complete len:524 (+) Transcript_8452:132-1703(+)|eukprot:CAMPEP_0196578812 /NCGR_PEP_ID=MMETSP1081-20130531/8357_1 /TAXON_ID=36882 /ORGANISM="Pyramimonas amylifera, Strain CCMP720" /LENGTH=523 /DNA_ID=CAMNT_0041898143 /DNA_START=114 /DNA_END=1685 /DNA_ORIENTATION=+